MVLVDFFLGFSFGYVRGCCESGFILILLGWIIYLVKKTFIIRCILYVIKCLRNFIVVKIYCKLMVFYNIWGNNFLGEKIVVLGFKKIFV